MGDPQFDNYRKFCPVAMTDRRVASMRKAIADLKLTIEETEPWSGYYRLRAYGDRSGPLLPLGVWRENGELVVVWGDVTWRGAEARIDRFWPNAVWNTVPYAWWRDKVENNKEWPDAHQPDPEEETGAIPAADRVVAHGDNAGAEITPAMILADKIDAEKRKAKSYSVITSAEHKVQSQEVRSALLKLSGEAKKTRNELLAPHKKAVEEINKIWKAMEDEAADAATAIRTAQETFATAELNRQRQERERLEEEQRQREAEAAAQAEEAAAAVEHGEAPPQPTFIAPPMVPERTAPQTSFKGATGRAAHEKAVEVIKEDDVEDWSKLFLYFVNNTEARTHILKLANSILKSHGEVPTGCKTRTVAKVA